MSRPIKERFVAKKPKIHKFSPRGRRGRPDYVILKLEEYEALRLIDFMGFKQGEAAKSMMISRQTFGRILKRGRSCISNALVNGKIIKINKA